MLMADAVVLITGAGRVLLEPFMPTEKIRRGKHFALFPQYKQRCGGEIFN